MNNKNIVILVGILIMGIVLSILYIFKYEEIDENILNKKWYRYDFRTGYYEILEVSKDDISYKKSLSLGETTTYDLCKNYNYNKKDAIIKLDCGIEFDILELTKNKLTLDINDSINVFYDNIEDSLNYEFNSYYNMSVSEYKESKSQVIDYMEVDIYKFIELYKTKDFSKIIFIDRSCDSIDCILALDIYEKWISLDSNNYFVDVSKFTDINLNYMKKLNSNIYEGIIKNTSIYPYIIIVNNKKIVDEYVINCNGFDCTSYYGL